MLYFWDQEALKQNRWSQPVSSEIISAAKKGDWRIHITKKPLPHEWLHDIKGKDILCLASAGGQQAPVLAAAGANVTVYDISEGQLEQDLLVAKRENIKLKTIQGDMLKLIDVADNAFDIIVHPISNLYVPDVTPVWKECYRVLRKRGVLLSSFYNPVLFIFDRDASLEDKGLIKPKFTIPYSDLEELSKQQLEDKVNCGEAICFGHSLSDLIDGQIQAGFSIVGFYEDEHPTPRFLIEQYMPTMIATKAIKL